VGVLATIRPVGWDLPLFLHVLGAMMLVGAAATRVRAAPAVVVGVALIGWLVAIWAMAAKPS
jgi:hypothetical protein